MQRTVLYIDCFAGIAGDMMLGALSDVGRGAREAIDAALAALPISGFRLDLERVRKNGISAKRARVEVSAGDQPERSFASIRDLLREAPLPAGVRDRALSIFEALAEAEARVHGVAVDDVHFHEVGAVDSIVDIVGAAAGLAHLGARVHSARVPLGSGFVACSHGTLPLPAPATLELLKGLPVRGTDVVGELVTPTGAAILRTQVTEFGPMPQMRPLAVGWGAGSRDHADRPGLLRLVLGELESDERAKPCVVVEANIDDMTAQVAAHAMERALAEGALDAWVTPITMKKGRPAMQLALLVRREDLDRLAQLLLAETTTIGLRHYEVGRMELPREMVTVETPWGPIPVKVSGTAPGPTNIQPELEACRKAALAAGVPLKQVLAVATAVALQGRKP